MATQTSCISHPPRQRLVVLREDYLALCEGNHCAAALLNFFEHGHNYKVAHQKDAMHANEVAQFHGDQGMQSTSLLQFHNQKGLEDGLLGLYQRSAIRKALDLLTNNGFVSVHKNPNPRYSFDKTHYFLFHPEAIQPQLIEMFDESFSYHRREQNGSSSEEKLSRREEKRSTRTEISSEIPHLEGENLAPTELSFPGEMNGVHPPGTLNGHAPVAIAPVKTKKGKRTPINGDEWPGLQGLLIAWDFPLAQLDDNEWWNALSYTCNNPSNEWLERQFAKIRKWINEHPTQQPTTRWKTFLGGWLERAYEWERKNNAPKKTYTRT